MYGIQGPNYHNNNQSRDHNKYKRVHRPSTKLQLGARDTLMDSNGTKIHLRDNIPSQWVTKAFSIVSRPPRASILGLENHKRDPLTQMTTNNTN